MKTVGRIAIRSSSAHALSLAPGDGYDPVLSCAGLCQLGMRYGISRSPTNISENTPKPEFSAHESTKIFRQSTYPRVQIIPSIMLKNRGFSQDRSESFGGGNNVAQNSLHMRGFRLHCVYTAWNSKSTFGIVASYGTSARWWRPKTDVP